LDDDSSGEKSIEKVKKKLVIEKESEKEENPETESSQMESKSAVKVEMYVSFVDINRIYQFSYFRYHKL
jgi:hypothetical protein